MAMHLYEMFVEFIIKIVQDLSLTSRKYYLKYF